MSTAKAIWDHPFTFWALLSLPAIPMILMLTSGDPKAVSNALHPWRHLGVAAFFYALAHTVLYLIDEGAVALTLSEASKLYIWTGWIAFLIFVPLAITSTDGWVRSLGRKWKPLQQFVYGAAVLTLVHWAALHEWGGVGPALVHFTPLVVLELYRFWSIQHRRRVRATA